MILTHHCSCTIIRLSCYFFTTLKFTCYDKNMSRQGSKRLISLSTVSLIRCCQESHNEDTGKRWDLPPPHTHTHTHTHIYNLIFISRHKGCCFTPFIYLVRVELESMRVSKYVSMCTLRSTCNNYIFLMWQGSLLCLDNLIYILYGGI